MAVSSYRRDINFRHDEISYILSKVKSGDSCSVVGVGSVGKSNLLRHLLQPKTQDYHIPGLSQEISMVLLDPNCMLAAIPYPHDLSSNSGWAGYELMAHRLYKALYPFQGFSEEQVKEIKWAYDQLLKLDIRTSLYGAPRYLESMLELLLDDRTTPTGSPRQLIFVFDAYEVFLKRLPAVFFQNMRGLRDDYKYRLSYITFTRQPLPQIIAQNSAYDPLELEPFQELFTDNTLYLGPYSETDATAMLDALTARKETAYAPSFRSFLLRASGRFAGLLRASFELARQIEFGTHESEALRFLMGQRAIQIECHTIWEALSDIEQRTLKQIANDVIKGLDDATVRLLSDKFLLVTESANGLEINPPLFREYVVRFAPWPDEQ